MTEYDYSPEAFERHLATQNRIANWVDKTQECAPLFGNPGVPSEAGVTPPSARPSHYDGQPVQGYGFPGHMNPYPQQPPPLQRDLSYIYAPQGQLSPSYSRQSTSHTLVPSPAGLDYRRHSSHHPESPPIDHISSHDHYYDSHGRRKSRHSSSKHRSSSHSQSRQPTMIYLPSPGQSPLGSPSYLYPNMTGVYQTQQPHSAAPAYGQQQQYFMQPGAQQSIQQVVSPGIEDTLSSGFANMSLQGQSPPNANQYPSSAPVWQQGFPFPAVISPPHSRSHSRHKDRDRDREHRSSRRSSRHEADRQPDIHIQQPLVSPSYSSYQYPNSAQVVYPSNSGAVYAQPGYGQQPAIYAPQIVVPKDSGGHRSSRRRRDRRDSF